jgi:predicted PurR-regulated permease PerM
MTAMQSNDQGDGVVLKLVPLEPNRGTGPATGLASGGAMGLPNLASVAIVVAIIYLAKAVILPLAIAMLITFALSPLVTRLRKLGLPNLPAVLLAVATAFAIIGLFFLVVVSQLGSLAQNLPQFQANIITKVDNIRAASHDMGVIGRLTDMISAINDKISVAVPEQPGAGAVAAPTTANPMPVELVVNKGPIGLLQDLVLPLISPIATIGLVIVIIIFMLLAREDLRDRFIRLVGSNDLHRTTQVLQDAGERVAQYLTVQLLVNLIYALPIGVGLWLIGVPNPALWGLVTLVMRFVPYIGTFIAAAFPLFLAFAVAPDWSAVLWTIGLFGAVELLTSNIIEPWLYGSRTGVSPLAIIISAIFWTWVWGPLGLVLSTPLTVCLVVLGRHIPQFEVFSVMFGDQPVLAAHERLYQRLLVGDAPEATAQSEEALEVQYLAEYYQDVGIPALLIAQQDRARGVLTPDQQQRFAVLAQTMVADLLPVVAEELAEAEAVTDGAAPPLRGAEFSVICLGGRSNLDDVAAAMLAQALLTEGAVAMVAPHTDLSVSRLRNQPTDAHQCAIISYLDPAPSRASFLHIRRIKQTAPHLRVGVVVWQMPIGATEGITNAAAVLVSEASLQQARDIGADFAVSNLESALKAALQHAIPIVIAPASKHSTRPRRQIVEQT